MSTKHAPRNPEPAEEPDQHDRPQRRATPRDLFEEFIERTQEESELLDMVRVELLARKRDGEAEDRRPRTLGWHPC